MIDATQERIYFEFVQHIYFHSVNDGFLFVQYIFLEWMLEKVIPPKWFMTTMIQLLLALLCTFDFCQHTFYHFYLCTATFWMLLFTPARFFRNFHFFFLSVHICDVDAVKNEEFKTTTIYCLHLKEISHSANMFEITHCWWYFFSTSYWASEVQDRCLVQSSQICFPNFTRQSYLYHFIVVRTALDPGFFRICK